MWGHALGWLSRQDFAAIEYRQAAIGGGGRVGRTVLAFEQGNFAEQLPGAENAEPLLLGLRATST